MAQVLTFIAGGIERKLTFPDPALEELGDLDGYAQSGYVVTLVDEGGVTWNLRPSAWAAWSVQERPRPSVSTASSTRRANIGY